MHAYSKTGEPVYEVPNVSKGGMRATTITDCRKRISIEYVLDRVKEDKNTGCLEWVSTLSPSGYGRVGVPHYTYFNVTRAHMLFWILFIGDYDRELYVCHRCNNRKCVNIQHLYLGTPQDNANDAVKAGTTLLGERNINCKTNRHEVALIKELLQTEIKPIIIGRLFGLSSDIVYNIKHGRTWRHI